MSVEKAEVSEEIHYMNHGAAAPCGAPGGRRVSPSWDGVTCGACKAWHEVRAAMVPSVGRIKIEGVSAAKIKTYRGMDGVGYNATLMIDGKAVASIFNEGSGGPTYLRDVKDPEAIKAFEAKVKALPPHVLPSTTEGFPAMTVDVCVDFFLGMFVEDALEDQRVAKLCKKNLVLRRRGDAPGQYLTVKAAVIDQKLREYVAKKHPDAEIVNDRLGIMPGVAPAPKKAAAKRTKATT